LISFFKKLYRSFNTQAMVFVLATSWIIFILHIIISAKATGKKYCITKKRIKFKSSRMQFGINIYNLASPNPLEFPSFRPDLVNLETGYLLTTLRGGR